jgi:hypothetical protein
VIDVQASAGPTTDRHGAAGADGRAGAGSGRTVTAATLMSPFADRVRVERDVNIH